MIVVVGGHERVFMVRLWCRDQRVRKERLDCFNLAWGHKGVACTGQAIELRGEVFRSIAPKGSILSVLDGQFFVCCNGRSLHYPYFAFL